MQNYLTDNLQFLTAVDTESLDKNLFYQLNILSPQDYNATQKELYAQLNQLYEKMRILEEVSDYLVAQIQTKIDTSNATCESLLKAIEQDRDSLKEATYQTFTVPLESLQNDYDRDGVLLKAAVIYNGQISNAYEAKHNLPYQMDVKQERPVYKQTANGLQNGQCYRSYYITDQCYPEGISETLYFAFHQAMPINYIAAKPSNAEISHYQSYNAGDTIPLKTLNWKTPLTSESVSFKINTKLFKEQTFTYDLNRMHANALTTLENEIYKAYIGEKTLSAGELNELLGINVLQTDYQAYLQKVEDWRARRQQVAATNQANGYEDAVPDYDIVKTPDVLGANQNTLQGLLNPTISTEDILPSYEAIGDSTRIVYMYDKIDSIYPSVERYRYDILDASHTRYYQNLNPK